MPEITRKDLLWNGVCWGAWALGSAVALRVGAQTAQSAIPDRGPRLEAALVEEFVRAAHGDLAKTQKMLDATPTLVNATWDWGGGDWETGLGGAAHMGNAEIARFLLGRGARMDVFCAAMLGEIAIVKAFLAFAPQVVDLAGPHGIPLIRHAMAGKQDAMVELLRQHGARG